MILHMIFHTWTVEGSSESKVFDRSEYEIPVTDQNVVSQSINTNTIQRVVRIFDDKKIQSDIKDTRGLKRVFLSDRSITCNDGTRAGFYLRKYYGSKKWIIFLEGGWYCYDENSCKSRWMKLRHLMTSTQWPETKDVGGLLSPNREENPYWWDSNHVFVPYCTSDAWSGTRKEFQNNFNFMGARIIEQTIRDLLPLGLENSTQMLLGGSSAGGTGAMVNLDTVRDMLHEDLGLRHIEVRGVIDSGWFLDRAPYAPGLPTVDAIRKGIKLWKGKMPNKCNTTYSNEPWRCYFGYRLYPTLKSPLFVFQWLFDEAQMSADNVGAPVTKQQWDYIHKMGDSLRHSFQNVSALFAPSCISHSVLTKRDWLTVKVDDTSVAQALKCWEQQMDNKAKRKTAMLRDEPRTDKKRNNKKKFENVRNLNHEVSINETRVEMAIVNTNPVDNERNRRKRKKNRRKNRNRLNKKRKGHKQRRLHNKNRSDNPDNGDMDSNRRTERSALRPKNRRRNRGHSRCKMRIMERCSWPQCNHSCPKLHNPYTGEELDFIELLKSFGLDMDSVAVALGIDIHTLNNMNQTELINLLTQSTS